MRATTDESDDPTMIQIKSPAEIAKMRVAGLVVGRTLAKLRAAVAPGVTTADLDALAEESIRGEGATPSFKGYGHPPFPATICASVNEAIVHGIPRASVVLREGDIVSIDCGAIVEGWHGDSAITVGVGEIDPESQRLLDWTEAAMWRGMAAAHLGGRVGDIGKAIEEFVRPSGLSIVEEYVGHGIGTEMHQDPPVHHIARAPRGPKIVEGLVLAVEPQLNLGTRRTRLLDDAWTVVTADGARSAHFEHTFTVTADGPIVLTALDGGVAGFASVAAAS
ncbi:MAG: methionyl aminopeptidase [Frankiaceae bacterium]|nr:methionyl aminopeptidase [Frankiaceae bacterium]